MNYKSLYDSYWQSDDRPSLGFDDARRLVDQILTVAGYARTLDVGSGLGRLVLELLASGVDASGIDVAPSAVAHANAFAPGRFREGSVLALPFGEDAFPLVVLTNTLEHLAETDLDVALREIWRVCGGTLFVKLATTVERDDKWRLIAKPRQWWEERMFTAGFRKHPLAQAVVSYEALETEGAGATIIMEKISADARARYPLDDLRADRDLHKDMMREAGRRSDAHIARYVLASRYVRAGDVVLDAACGLGYGSHILAYSTGASRVIGIDNSPSAVAYATANFARGGGCSVSFEVADAHDLSSLPEHSVDLVVSMETLEHLSKPQAFLTEARRVLRPSGRIIVSVPNQWLDKTGREPNPYHAHVCDLTRLQELLSAYFDLELLWLQTAGGGMKSPQATRRISELGPDRGDVSGAEWLIALGMKSPLRSEPAVFGDAAFPAAQRAGGHVVAFDKWYCNPWLPRSLVTRGSRANGPLLHSYASTVAAKAQRESADRGAALCVLAYRLLEERESRRFQSEALAVQRDLATYLNLISSNPHVQRWQISCAYVLGLLSRAIGDIEGAEKAFRNCTGRNPLSFSPLIATKTLSAHAALAKIYLGRDDIESARLTLEEALETATQVIGADWVNVIGAPNDPYPFGFHELSEVADIASRCALMLEAVNRGWSRQFAVARMRISHGETIEALRRALVERTQACDAAYRNLSAHSAEIAARRATEADLASKLRQYDERIALLEGEARAKDEEIGSLTSILRERNDDIVHLRSEIGAREESLAELRNLLAESQRVRSSMERAAAINARQHSLRVAQLEAISRQLEARSKEIAELRSNRAEFERSLVEREERLAELRNVLAESERVRSSMETAAAINARQHSLSVAQLETISRQLEGKNTEIAKLGANLAEFERNLMEREERIACLESDSACREQQLAEVDRLLKESERARQSIEGEAATKENENSRRLAELQRQCDYWETRARDLTVSTSWQLTAPLRAVSEAARLLIRHPTGTMARFGHMRKLYRSGGTRLAATWLWSRLSQGRIGAFEIPKSTYAAESKGAKRNGRQAVRIATLRWRTRRLSDITRSQGAVAAVRAALRHLERRYLPYRLVSQRAPAPNGALGDIRNAAPDAVAVDAPRSNRRVVAMLVDAFTDGGMERVTIDLCRSLRARGYVPTILVATSGGRSAQEARDYDLAVHEFGGNPERLAAWLDQVRPSLVLAHHCYFELQQFKAAGVPIVEVLHNAYFWQVGEAYVGLQRRNNVDESIAVSDFVKDYAVGHLGLSADKITTIPNGLDIAGFVRPPIALMNARRLQTLHSPVLVFVANLHPQKNHRGVIHAFARVLQRYPAARLKIAGALDGNDALRRRLEEDVRSLDLKRSLEFLGPLNRRALSQVLADAHIGLLPTHLEGFSIVTLEYAFFGLPSVLSETGAARSLAREHGHALLALGCALPPERLSIAAIEDRINGSGPSGCMEIAEAVAAQLRDYPAWLQQASEAARRSGAYSFEASVDRYVALIEGVLGRGGDNGSKCAARGRGDCSAVSDRP